MDWMLPPPSECGEFKLVATDLIGNEIYLLLIGEGIGVVKKRLADMQKINCEKLAEYIAWLLPGIQSGLYDPAEVKNY